MAWASGWEITIVLFFLLFLTPTNAGDPTHLFRAIQGGDQTPMILPLFFSHHNSSLHREAGEGKNMEYRRKLQKADTRGAVEARMGLYDNLLTNGYYTTRLFIGTPPQEFALIVDSGSTVTYVPCSTCERCGNHQDPRFQPEMSSSYKPVQCSINCNCDEEKKQCLYERKYAEMSSSSGVLGEDVVSFGNESSLKPQNAIFGCENLETGDLFTQRADGIMGLGRGHLSIMDQLVEKGAISDSFSLCYGGMDLGGGAMVLGGIPSPLGMVFSRSDPVRSPYYNIDLKEIHVSGKALQLSPSVFDGKHGTVLDSGTTYAYLPESAFVAFKAALMEQVQHLHKIRGPDPTYKDICFSGAGSDVSQLSTNFPEVNIVFSNGQKLLLSPENYLFRHSKVPGAYCLGIFQNGRDPTTLLGGILVRNTLVTYDRQNERVGFWKTNCSELWDKLQVNGSPLSTPKPSLPPDSYPQNSTVAPSLAPSPSGMHVPILPGHLRVGLITFDMYVSINSSVLEPHIPDLIKLIAHDLEVNVTQVHVISLQNKGNGSFIRLSVFPAGTDEFMSKSTATAIISRLIQHSVHLPGDFGSYQLLDWKADEHVSNRTWWQRHIFAVAITMTAVSMLCISIVVLYLWNSWREARASYRPVDAPGPPEHELQPL